MKRFTLAIALCLGSGFATPVLVWGQQTETTIVDSEIRSSLSLSPSSDGRLLIVAFKNGIPASGVVVQTANGPFTTNSDGVISLYLPAPQTHRLEVKDSGQVVRVQVVPDEESQVTIHLLDTKTEVAVDAASGATLAAPAKAGVPQSVEWSVESQNQEALPEATLLFSGLETVYKTDAQGRLKADIPEGTYTVSVFHPQFQTQTITDYKVVAGTQLREIQLKPAENSLEEVLVLAPKIKGSLSALVEVRRQSSAVTDVLGAEQMARAGDSDAASSLRRVTGLTLVGGKYVYVRGLGERYSGVQMNSFSLPSPEPTRRVVPLDLFPTAIMESIIVQKSYSPDLPGEFGGGLIQLKTRSLPEQFFFRSALSTAYENVSNRLEQKGGSSDWLGMDDGTRKMPALIQSALAQGKKLEVNIPGFSEGVSEQELVAMGRSLPNNYNLDHTPSPSLPGLALSLGNGWKFEGGKIGTSASALYGQTTDQLTRIARTFNLGAGDKLERDTVRSTEYSEVETRVAASYDVGVELGADQKITASTFLLRNTSALTQIDRTRFVSGPDTQGSVADFTERQLWTRHLKGEHGLDRAGVPLQIDWRLGWSDAQRDSPDRREISYMVNDSSQTLLDGALGNRRTWSTLEDNSQEQALNFTVPIKNSQGREYLKMKTGVLRLTKDRASDVTRLYFNPGSGGAPIDYTQDAESILSKENIGPGQLMLKNIFNDADAYTGQQEVSAEYFMAEISPWDQVSVQAGFRQERSSQVVKTFRYFQPGQPTALAELKMNDLLPAYGIVWKPNDHWRARLAYSETLARPDFRELSTVGFVDDETRNLVQGNADLQGTVIKNIDHRWEYYFTSDEYASVGVFYKEFQNPIEVIFLPGVNRIQSFENAKGAQNFGVEFEGRVGARHFSRFLRRWTMLSNLTLIQSEIELSEQNRGIQTSGSRPLQGQSPYVLNLQLQYDRPQWGFSSTLLFNVVGKRITEVGTLGIPDTFEQPFEQLDLVATQRLQKNWTLSVRARNLLNPDIESTQGNEIVREQKRGRLYSLVLGAVF